MLFPDIETALPKLSVVPGVGLLKVCVLTPVVASNRYTEPALLNAPILSFSAETTTWFPDIDTAWPNWSLNSANGLLMETSALLQVLSTVPSAASHVEISKMYAEPELVNPVSSPTAPTNL